MTGIWRGNDRRTGWLSGICMTLFAALLGSIAGCGEAEVPILAQPENPAGELADLSAAYTVRLDSERSHIEDFRLEQGEQAVHIVTGPAGIAFQAEDQVQSGDFRVEATFVQFDAPVGYREAYGIFVGGRDLVSPDQEYTYLLVRPTGDYLVKRRIGEILETLVDWTAHEAVQSVANEGDEPQNTLTVEVVRGETRFGVNGSVVHTMPASRARPYGVAGIRANHQLHIRVAGWSLTTPDSDT